MSLLMDVADAVVAELNAGNFSQPFTATRRYDPRRPLKDLSTLRVDVVPSQPSMETTPTARDDVFQNDISVDVAVRKKFADGDFAELDPLMDLIEEITEHFQKGWLSDLPHAVLQGIEVAAVADAEYMQTKRVFFSLLMITVRVHTTPE